MNKKDCLLSIGFGLIALAAGTICHRVAPGLGVVIMPMFWPLAVLSALVPTKYSVTTAALVPFVSFALTGMPAMPIIVALKFAIYTFGAAFLLRRILARRR